MSLLGKGDEALAAANVNLNDENLKFHQLAWEAAGSKKDEKSTCDGRCNAKVCIIKDKDAENFHEDRDQKDPEQAAKKVTRSTVAAFTVQRDTGKNVKGKRVSFIDHVEDSEVANELEALGSESDGFDEQEERWWHINEFDSTPAVLYVEMPAEVTTRSG